MSLVVGTFATQHASKYLQQLCKHFAHKVDVTHDETSGEVVFPFGVALMTANDGELRVSIDVTDAEEIPLAKDVIDSHLVKFAFREGFKEMAWGMSE